MSILSGVNVLFKPNDTRPPFSYDCAQCLHQYLSIPNRWNRDGWNKNTVCVFPAGAADVYLSPATLRCFHNTSTLSWCFTSTEDVWLIRDGNLVLNSFTAPACIISLLKTAHTDVSSTFSGSITNLISILYVLLKIFSHANAKRKTAKLKDLKFCTFIGFQVPSWQ